MTSIVKCSGKDCPIKMKCYRHTAFISCVGELCEKITVKDFSYDSKTESCEDFIQNTLNIDVDCY